MQIHDWGEDRFIDYLSQTFSVKKEGILGIGDDCAVIPFDDKRSYLVTTDALVEGVHFLKEQISPLTLGVKTVAVNVSDIVAMGGTPRYAFLSIAIPAGTEQVWLTSFIQGIKEACEKWGISLLGGDTVGSKRDLFLNLTLVGTAATDHIKYRSGAKVNDIICVSGYLGDSAAGLKVLGASLSSSQANDQLIYSHFHPQPNPEEGKWLAMRHEVHAMMDLSDGLHCDLTRLLKASNCGAVIEMQSIPLSEPLQEVSARKGWNAMEIAIAGGEDYCLLLTVDKESFKQLESAFLTAFKEPLYPIGWITDSRVLEYQENGRSMNISIDSFKHF